MCNVDVSAASSTAMASLAFFACCTFNKIAVTELEEQHTATIAPMIAIIPSCILDIYNIS